MNLTVTVLHNVSQDTFLRYDTETSHLFHAHTFEVVADGVDQAAELIWMLTNVDDANALASMRADLSPYGPQVTAYRRRKNRSLSVGDVVFAEERQADGRIRPAGVRAVASVGWGAIEGNVGYTDGDNSTEISQAYLGHQARARRGDTRVETKRL